VPVTCALSRDFEYKSQTWTLLLFFALQHHRDLFLYQKPVQMDHGWSVQKFTNTSLCCLAPARAHFRKSKLDSAQSMCCSALLFSATTIRKAAAKRYYVLTFCPYVSKTYRCQRNVLFLSSSTQLSKIGTNQRPLWCCACCAEDIKSLAMFETFFLESIRNLLCFKLYMSGPHVVSDQKCCMFCHVWLVQNRVPNDICLRLCAFFANSSMRDRQNPRMYIGCFAVVRFFLDLFNSKWT
jgi:hypothetical protein